MKTGYIGFEFAPAIYLPDMCMNSLEAYTIPGRLWDDSGNSGGSGTRGTKKTRTGIS